MSEFICNTCCTKFDKSWKLERHINGKRKCKSHIEMFNHLCNYCNNNYSTKYYLEKHMKICSKKINYENNGEVQRPEFNLNTIQNSNVSIDSSTNNNNIIHSNNAINSNNNNNNITNVNIPDFIYPFGYEDMSYISDDEKLRILTSDRAIIEALKVIYSKPQNCNIYRPNANKDNIAFISIDIKHTKQTNSDANIQVNNSDDEVSVSEDSTQEESIHNEPRHDESSFEEDIESESEQNIDRQKQYRKTNITPNTITIQDFDISTQSIKYKSMCNKITKNATDFLLRLLHACKYKLTCQDQLCILENIEDNRIHVSRDFYIEYVVNFLESHFRDIVYKDIFKKYDVIIRKEQNFKTNKLETVKNLIKELERFINDKTINTINTINEDFLTEHIWTEEKNNRDDIDITDNRNNLEENEIEDTPRYKFFEDMKELEIKYFSEHGMSIGNLYKYRKILLERAQQEVNILSEEYNNQLIKDKIIRKLIKNNTYTLIRRLKDIRFIDPLKLVSGTDTKRFSKLTYKEKEMPVCLINYIKGITEYEGFID